MPHTVGILFVHGIGTQACGDTLLHFGGAVHRWLKGWLQGLARGGDVEVLDTRLQPSPEDPLAPAHTRLLIRPGEGRADESWLLAESWWADVFRPPRFADLAYWLLAIVPPAIPLHFAPRIRDWLGLFERGSDIRDRAADRAARIRGNRPMARGLGELFVYALLTPLAMVIGLTIQALTLLLMALALAPVGPLRRFTGSVQQQLAASVGDSFIFLTSPFERSAIASRVQRDLGWLAARCEHVVVVAHSQGGAVSHLALEGLSGEGQTPKNMELLITFGSGLRKLFDLRQLLNKPVGWMMVAWSVVGVASGMLASVAAWALGLAGLWAVLLVVPAGAVFIAIALIAVAGAIKNAPLHLDVPWQDYYSTHDPVPNGPLLGQDEVTRIRSREVLNMASVTRDHTAYWSAMDDFVARVVGAVARYSAVGELLEGDLDKRLEWAGPRRAWRVRLLSWTRRLSALSAILVLASPPSELTTLGATAAAWLASALASWSGWLPWALTPLPDLLRRPAVLGSVMAVLGISLGYQLAFRGWRRWEQREFAGFFAPPLDRPGGGGLVVFAVGAAAVALVGAWTLMSGLPPLVRPPSGAWSWLAALSLTLVLVSVAIRRRPRSRG